MMKKFMKKLWEKKDSKKGFTLVELIVVLVILAILAAIMVPALIGWIDKAKEKEVILEARNAYLAAQLLVQEEYAKEGHGDVTSIDNDDIEEISKGGGTSTIGSVDSATYIITNFTYKGDNYTATYANESWTVAPN